MASPSLLLIVALLARGEVKGGTMAVTVVRPDGGPLPPRVTVEARRIGGGEPVRRVGPSVSFELEAGSWVVQASAPGFWGEATEASLMPTPQGLKTEVRIFPARSVSVKVESENPARAAGLLGPKELRLVFSTPPGAQISLARGQVQCDPGWVCTLPNLDLDVQVRSVGFVPHYLWNVKRLVSSLGPFRLARGASVSGFVLVRGRPALHCRVSLQTPEGTAIRNRPGMPEGSHESGLRGFFQLVGMPPGHYQIAADCGASGRATARAKVVEGTESQLVRPLQPDRGGELRIRLDPPVAPSGRPWRAQISPEATTTATLYEGTVGTDGVFRRPGVASGRYRVRVSDGADRWVVETFEFDPSTDEIVVQVPVDTVRGQVFWGAAPLKAKLALGGKHGAVRVVLETDDEGRFEASVPEALAARDTWKVAVYSEEAGIDVTLEKVHADGAFLRIVVPKSGVAGRLIDAESKDLKGAVVRLAPESGSEAGQSVSQFGSDGSFEFLGIPQGKYVMFGESGEKLTERMHVDVEKDRDVSGLLLTLRSTLMVTVHVVTPEGTAVPGAMVGLVPTRAMDLPGTLEPTNIEGEASFRLLPAWDGVALTVAARGYGFHLGSYVRERGKPILVQLGRSVAELAIKMDPSTGDDLFLLREGSFVDVRALAGSWSRPTDPAFGHSLRDLEPGAYRLCRAKNEDVGGILRSGFAAARACKDVLLEPSGITTVELP